MQRLEGRIVIVTGASSGIGEAVAIAFAEVGAKVVLAARRQDRLDALAQRIAQAGGEALAVATDVTDEAAVERLFATAVEKFGRVDVLINNAGIADSTACEDLALERWQQVLDTNLTSAFLCSRAAFRLMKPQGRGRIINVGSISARVPRPESPAYTASKFGLDGLTRSLAVDGRDHGIAVSIYHPGIVNTELGPNMGKAPAERTSDPRDTAEIILHMASVPDHMNFYEALMVQLAVPFLGRG
ncbi:SDR family oxidoreductase [Parasphingopyxis marina]|uniref:SDR family oxidoreductase n=1 Tax=Parasphingopyxis marina TaxID=2761622 RepID=A0A842HXB1_9SPHN|nr:SDR family oxidoreductase [Parasphingopyxis marina]MBC2776580.1 SDR family oxidoreductase [Parasphingopyxis marina]